MYQRIERSLTSREISLLNTHIGRANRERRAVALMRPLAQGAVFMLVAAPLAGWLAGRSFAMSLLWALSFILLMTPAMIFMNRKKQDRVIGRYRSILTADRAVAHVVQAQDCIRFEEREDEGDLWMFQVAPDQLVILQGQDYYASKRFPALNFEIIEMGDLPIRLVTQSEKITPRETISSSGQNRLPRVRGVLMMNGNLSDPARVLDDITRTVR